MIQKISPSKWRQPQNSIKIFHQENHHPQAIFQAESRRKKEKSKLTIYNFYCYFYLIIFLQL